MNIVLTGSLGRIGKPLAQDLVKKGHSVSVITSKAERQKDIESLGAKAEIGTIQDVEFLTRAFKGADIVYLMETLEALGGFFNQDIDFIDAISGIGRNYKEAIEATGVKRVVHLSSIGAHMDKGNGILIFHHNVENILKKLPGDVSIKFIRPVGFYTNLFSFIKTIKAKEVIISNYGGDRKEPWVSPFDIASAIAEEMEKPFEGRTVRYVASDEVSTNDIARTLGVAIGIPDLKWSVVPDEQVLEGMLKAGMNSQIANGFVQMQAAQGTGVLYEDYNLNKPTLSKVKLIDFSKVFAQHFNQ